jgi:hypothetical protein
MNLDEMIKYLIWIIFFVFVLGGLYLVLKRIGVV